MVRKRKLIQYLGLAVAVILLLCGILNAPNLHHVRAPEAQRASAEPAAPIKDLRVPFQPRSGLPGVKDPLGALYATTMIEDTPIWLESHMGHGDNIVSCLFNLPTFGTCILPELGQPPAEVFSNLQALSNAGAAGRAEPPPAERRTEERPIQLASQTSAERSTETGIGGYESSPPVIGTQTPGQLGSPGTEAPATIPPILVATTDPIAVSLSGTPYLWNPPSTGGLPSPSSSPSSPPSSSPSQAQSPAQDPASNDGAVPEPATTGMMVLLLGCGLIGRWRMRRSNSS